MLLIAGAGRRPLASTTTSTASSPIAEKSRDARNNPRFVPAGTIGPAGQDPSLSDRPCASEIACEPENQED